MLKAFKSGKEVSQKNREINYMKKTVEDKEIKAPEADSNEDHIGADSFSDLVKEIDQEKMKVAKSLIKNSKTC